MISKTYFHGSFLSSWNNRMLREDGDNSGLFDKQVKQYIVGIGLKYQGKDQFRNLYSHAALMQSIESYFNVPSVDRYNDQRGISLAEKQFSNRNKNFKLEALRLDDVKLQLKAKIKGDKSAGLTRYGATKTEAWSFGLEYAIKVLRGKTPHPCLAGYRTQSTHLIVNGIKKHKTRLVWMYPLEMTILESLIARPIIKEFMSRPTPMLFGKYASQISSMFHRADSLGNFIVGTDFSKFDQHVSARHIKFAFKVIRSWFDLDQQIGYGFSLSDVFKVVEKYFIYTPIVVPTTEGPQLWRGKRSGVPSGSYFTQLIDSIVNYVVVCQSMIDSGCKFSPRAIFVLGDDMIAFTFNKVKLSALVSKALRMGYLIHDDEKSEIVSSGQKFQFLGRTWEDYLPIRNIDEVLERALYPERWRKYQEENTLIQAGMVFTSYGLTSFIRNARFQRGLIEGVPKRMLTGYLRYLAEETDLIRKSQAQISAVY